MKNFVDLIVDAAKDSALGEAFGKQVESGDHKGISAWLKDKGYDVHEDECKKLVDNKDNVKASKLGLYY
jgi:hypothetical protein